MATPKSKIVRPVHDSLNIITHMLKELCKKFRHYIELNSAQNSRQRVNLFDYEEKQYLDIFIFE